VGQFNIDKVFYFYKNSEYIKAKKLALKFLKKNNSNLALLNILGLIYTNEYDFINAKKMYKKAINIFPKSAKLYSNLANVYQEETNFSMAEELYLKTILLTPTNEITHIVYHNLANLYVLMHRYDLAEEMFNKAFKIKEDDRTLLFEYSLFLLKSKQYIDGFDLYRNRLQVQNNIDALGIEVNILTKGNDIYNKMILLVGEQGYGDIIQFMRYIPLFKKAGAIIYIITDKLLERVLKINYPEIVFVDDINKYKYDYQIPFMDAAYFFSTSYETIPFQDKYLKVNQADSKIIYDKYFKNETKKKIGIVWRSNIGTKDTIKKKAEREDRNIDLNDFLNYFLLEDIQLYSLQYGTTLQEKELLKKNNILSLGDNLVDFYDNALVIDNLDALISIETVMVVIAGAMCKETTVLLSENPGWLWGFEGDSTNWYRSLNLLRKSDTWDITINEIAKSQSLFKYKISIEMKIAIKYHQENNLIEAEKMYRKVLKNEPNNADAYHYLGVIAFDNGFVKESIILIKESIRLNPELDEAYINLKKIVESIHKII